MSDAERIWREADGQAKQRTVRSLWPQLAAALDGVRSAVVVDRQPICQSCGASSGKLAVCRAGNIAICGVCAGKGEFQAMGIVRVAGWSTGRAEGWGQHPKGHWRKET